MNNKTNNNANLRTCLRAIERALETNEVEDYIFNMSRPPKPTLAGYEPSDVWYVDLNIVFRS